MTWIKTTLRQFDEVYFCRRVFTPFDIEDLRVKIQSKLHEAIQVGKIEGEQERRHKLVRDLYVALANSEHPYWEDTLEAARTGANAFEPERNTLTVIASPYAGDREKNYAYMCRAIKDCIERGESPYVPHAIFPIPGVLDDNIPEERAKCIELGAQWLSIASRLAVYEDLGVTKGMQEEIAWAESFGCPVERRRLDEVKQDT